MSTSLKSLVLTAVRTKDFKLVDNFLENDIDELYDLLNDPGEMNNLINDENFDGIEEDLRKESERLQKKYKYNPDRDWWPPVSVRVIFIFFL